MEILFFLILTVALIVLFTMNTINTVLRFILECQVKEQLPKYRKYLSHCKSSALGIQKQQLQKKKQQPVNIFHLQHRRKKQPGTEGVIYFLFIFIPFSLHNKRQEW